MKTHFVSRKLLFVVLLLIALASTGQVWAAGNSDQSGTTVGSLSSAQRAQAAPTATVVTGTLNVRSGPGINFPVVAKIYQGNVVALIGRNSNSAWVRVRLAPGQEGWVNAAPQYIQPSVAISSLPVVDGAPAPAPAPTTPPGFIPSAAITVPAANIYAGPGTNFTVIATSLQGHIVHMLARTPDALWVRVRIFSGQIGWVSANALQPNMPISNLPVIGAPGAPAPGPVTDPANVRSLYAGPGTTYSIVGTVHQGQNVTLLGRNSQGNWVKVLLDNGVQGWISASLVRADVPLFSLPVVDGAAPPAPAPKPAPQPPQGATAVVTTGALNVRSGPGIGYSSITVIHQGQVVSLIGRNNDSSWVRVRLVTGQEGWVNASLIQANVAIGSLPVVPVPTLSAVATVTTGALNVRSGPGINFPSTAVVYQGQTVTLLGRNANSSWVQVRLANGHVGWVNTSLVQPNVSVSTLPVTG
ncbi:MAG TPA: SH3 domain-containing protein [Anaerolineae bacterium]